MIYTGGHLFYFYLHMVGNSFFKSQEDKKGKRGNSSIMLKDCLYYCWISKEGLDTETKKVHVERFIDKTKSRICRLCSQLFIITKNFKDDENTCNSCFKITSDIDKFGKMHVILKINAKYIVFTNLWRSFNQEIMSRQNVVDKPL